MASWTQEEQLLTAICDSSLAELKERWRKLKRTGEGARQEAVGSNEGVVSIQQFSIFEERLLEAYVHPLAA